MCRSCLHPQVLCMCQLVVAFGILVIGGGAIPQSKPSSRLDTKRNLMSKVKMMTIAMIAP